MFWTNSISAFPLPATTHWRPFRLLRSLITYSVHPLISNRNDKHSHIHPQSCNHTQTRCLCVMGRSRSEYYSADYSNEDTAFNCVTIIVTQMRGVIKQLARPPTLTVDLKIQTDGVTDGLPPPQNTRQRPRLPCCDVLSSQCSTELG